MVLIFVKVVQDICGWGNCNTNKDGKIWGLATVLQESNLVLQWFANWLWLYSFKLLQEGHEPCWVLFENYYSLDDAWEKSLLSTALIRPQLHLTYGLCISRKTWGELKSKQRWEIKLIRHVEVKRLGIVCLEMGRKM